MKNTHWGLLAIGASTVVFTSACGGTSATDQVHVNHSGGSLSQVYKDHWFTPLQERTGLTVSESTPADLARLQAQADSGQMLWDVPELESGIQYQQAIDQDLLEPLDIELLQSKLDAASGDQLDLTADFVDGSVGSHAVWGSPFATILMFDERVFPASGAQPDSLDDLWNLEEFPGRRCLSDSAQYNLEIALRADDVPVAQLYPLDVERALAKLGQLQSSVGKYWRAGAEPVQLVSSGECVMSTVWNGRPFASDLQDGIDYFGIAWQHGILDTSWRGVSAGAPNRDGAYEALAQYLTTDFGVEFANATGYASGNAEVPQLIDERTLEYLATEEANLAGLTLRDDRWWMDKGADAEERFAEWRRG